jgi:hypothetical protein
MPDIPEWSLLDGGLDAVELPPQAANTKAKRRLARRLHKKRLFIYPHFFLQKLDAPCELLHCECMQTSSLLGRLIMSMTIDVKVSQT